MCSKSVKTRIYDRNFSWKLYKFPVVLSVFFNDSLIVRGGLVTRDTPRSNCPARVAQFPWRIKVKLDGQSSKMIFVMGAVQLQRVRVRFGQGWMWLPRIIRLDVNLASLGKEAGNGTERRNSMNLHYVTLLATSAGISVSRNGFLR